MPMKVIPRYHYEDLKCIVNIVLKYIKRYFFSHTYKENKQWSRKTFLFVYIVEVLCDVIQCDRVAAVAWRTAVAEIMSDPRPTRANYDYREWTFFVPIMINAGRECRRVSQWDNRKRPCSPMSRDKVALRSSQPRTQMIVSGAYYSYYSYIYLSFKYN